MMPLAEPLEAAGREQGETTALSAISISQAPSSPDFVRFGDGTGQRFMVTVDTEEEFDWSAPIDRQRHSIDTIPRLRKFQQFCEGFGVPPVYLIDYPIASSPMTVDVLGEAVASGKAEIGVQLHPWVSPPYVEDVTEYNTFAGNLPAMLERDKFMRLRDEIEKAFGRAPVIYRAGRYGTGPNTAEILCDAGIAIDTSVRTFFDYSAAGGVNYREHPERPYWIDRERGLMELPLTTVFWGPLRRQGAWLYPKLWRMPRLRGALSRLGLLERIPLTPEGVGRDEALRGIDVALDDGLPVLIFSFHSPSLAPGYTPYVRSESDLDAFYDWWRAAFTHLARRDVRPASVAEVMASVALA